jgi:hypothetical protein
MDLAHLARKYIWWQSPERTLRDHHRLIAQVMDIGSHTDDEALRSALGDEAFKLALEKARAGEFSARSWHYWHLVLGTSKPRAVPPLPKRTLS